MHLIQAVFLCIYSSVIDYKQSFQSPVLKLEGGLETHLYSGDISNMLDRQYGAEASLGFGLYNTIISPGISLVFGSTSHNIIYQNQAIAQYSSTITNRLNLDLMHCINFKTFTLMPQVGIGVNSLQISQDSDPSTKNYRLSFSDFAYGCEFLYHYGDIYEGSKFISFKFERAIIMDHVTPGNRMSFSIEMGILGWIQSK